MENKKIWPAFIVGIALIISAISFGCFYQYAQVQTNSKDSLAVTGSTKIRVSSDQAKLILNISRIVPVGILAEGYSEMAKDLNLSNELLKKNALSADKIVVSPISMSQVYDSYNGSEIRYQLNQTITIQDENVQKITNISQEIPSLVASGAIVSVQSLEYYYSKLPELRVSLLSDAVSDAKARAEKIASGTGRQIGSVMSASNGVVQVVSPNSVDVLDYGSYDTSSIEKDIMVTIKASFRLN